MSRLYIKIWLALVAAVALSLIGGAFSIHMLGSAEPDFTQPTQAYALSIIDGDWPADPSTAAAVVERATNQGVDLTLYGSDGKVAANTGLGPLPRPRSAGAHWVRSGAGGGLAVPLQGGAFAVVGHLHAGPGPILTHIATVLCTIFLLLAAGAWPLARNLTRRLEELRSAVEDLGAGDLDRRLPVKGTDEVAQLTQAFNLSAARISDLVTGQRRVLAAASHELRSPLARIRMASELLHDGHGDKDALLAEMGVDIMELDTLIGDVLLASRLDAGTAPPPDELVDLGELAREEAARVGATASGEATITGDPRMLRVLLRNLLENAKRYGADPVAVAVSSRGLTVTDAGAGIPQDQRERVFEPFYRPQGHKESSGGSGLGLSLVRRIARHHSGDAVVQDRAIGSAIDVTLSAS